MEGGIAVLLVLVIVVVAALIAFASFSGGSLLWWRRTHPGEGDPSRSGRPVHTRPRDPAQDDAVEVFGEHSAPSSDRSG